MPMTTLVPETRAPDLRLAGDAELRATHISWVFVARERAYKVKKPVRLAYVDYATLARRRSMCRAEVALNGRLAPDVYLGVRSLVPAEGGGLRLAEEEDPAAVEYAVEMRRFDESHTLAARLAAGTAGESEVTALGGVLARFHATAVPVTAGGGAERVKRSLDDDFASLEAVAEPALRHELSEDERFTAALLQGRWDQLERRAAAGLVRDGHGDLRLEHVLLEREIEVVDCVEFDPALRRIDVAEDLAFLVMELHAAARPELAVALVDAYRAAGGHPGDDALLAFFAAYRAQVRAKVALTRAFQPDADLRARTVEAAALLRLGRRLQWAATGPRVIVVGGVAAAGKTTVADALAERSGFARVSSDIVRKQRAGLDPTRRAPAALYEDGWSRETYTAMAERARALAAGGVIVDATFRRRADRDAFFAALGWDVPALVVECRAPLHVLERRAIARELAPRNMSDADRAIVLAQAGTFEPLDEIPAVDHVVVRTDRPVPVVVDLIAGAACRPR